MATIARILAMARPPSPDSTIMLKYHRLTIGIATITTDAVSACGTTHSASRIIAITRYTSRTATTARKP